MATPGVRRDDRDVTSTHDLGRLFEDAVALHLSDRGWQILARNVRFQRREIDLVVRRDGVVAFVEVKGRRGGAYGHPLEAITWRKRREIEAVAGWWIERFGEPGLSYRFDAVSVERSRDGRLSLHHVEDAWRPG
jgi:putative endonuclease